MPASCEQHVDTLPSREDALATDFLLPNLIGFASSSTKASRTRATGLKMAPAGKYLYFAMMDVSPDKEALLNEVYDTEHVPALLKVPGVRSITRCKAEDFAMIMAGERREISAGDTPTYVAIYEIDSPEVLTSPEWAEAVDMGRWPEQVRPFTSNRRQVLRKII